MAIRTITFVDDEHYRNELRIVYDSDTNRVYAEIYAKHGGDTIVVSTVRMSREVFSSRIRDLGALP